MNEETFLATLAICPCKVLIKDHIQKPGYIPYSVDSEFTSFQFTYLQGLTLSGLFTVPFFSEGRHYLALTGTVPHTPKQI